MSYYFPIELDSYNNEQIKTITSQSVLFSSKEKLVIHFISGRKLTIIPEEPIALWKFIDIKNYNIGGNLEDLTLGKKNSDIYFFPNSNYHAFYNTEEVSSFFLLNNMIIEKISLTKKDVSLLQKEFDAEDLLKKTRQGEFDQYWDNMVKKKTVINRVYLNGKINFDNGYNYILFSDDSPKMKGISEVSLSITPRPGFFIDNTSYGLIIK